MMTMKDLKLGGGFRIRGLSSRPALFQQFNL